MIYYPQQLLSSSFLVLISHREGYVRDLLEKERRARSDMVLAIVKRAFAEV